MMVMHVSNAFHKTSVSTQEVRANKLPITRIISYHSDSSAQKGNLDGICVLLPLHASADGAYAENSGLYDSR